MSYSDFKLERSMVLRYVVPFYFESPDQSSTGGYNNISQILEQTGKWSRETSGKRDRDVYEYVFSSVCPEGDLPHIGQSWLYDFHNKPPQLRYAADAENPVYHYWTIAAAGMYVFKSNVGFLWYELVPAKKERTLMDADELIRFQYAFKELCRSKRDYALQVLIPRTQAADTDNYADFHPGKWVCGILEPIFGYIHFQSSRRIRGDGEAYCESPDQALLFHYLLMNAPDTPEAEKELHGIAYLLSNGQTTRYRIAEDFESQMVSPFGGVCWYASKDGCGYYALRSEGNGAFFANDLPARIRAEYFLLYILSLHQSYSLLNYLRRISMELPAEAEKYTVPSPAGAHLDELVAEINTFLMKSMYFSVSHIQHQNTFFEYLQKRLRIREDIEGISVGTNAVVKLQRVRKENEEKRIAREEEQRREQEQRERELQQQREEASDRSLNSSVGLLSLFAIFSAFNDFTQLWTGIQKSQFNPLDSHAWQQLGAYFWDCAPWSLLLALCYLIIIVLSAVCIYVVTKTALRHMIRGKKRR